MLIIPSFLIYILFIKIESLYPVYPIHWSTPSPPFLYPCILSMTVPEGTPCSELYGGAPPERGAFFKLAVYKRVGKIAILVYERLTKSAAKWKKWWLRRSISKGATFGRNDYATESERPNTREKRAITGNSIVFLEV